MFSHDSPHSPEFSPSLSSVESLRFSLPQEHQSLFDTLQKEVMDFCDLHHIPTSSLHNDEALREATKHLSIPDLKRLSLVLKRLEYLVTHKKPLPPEQDPAFQEALEYANEHYNLQEQYTSQVSLLEQVGILKEGHIEVIDGKRYPVPTLEQIALRLFERRQELSPKHDQGFTKLLLVPFGMSLDTLRETLKQFLLDHKKKHLDFELKIDDPLYTRDDYQRADIKTNPDGFPILVYHPTSFDRVNHQGKTKAQILEEQSQNPSLFPGWTIHLFQPAGLSSGNLPSPFLGKEGDQRTLGIAPIPRKGKGKTHGQGHEDSLDLMTPSRPDIEAGKSPTDYLSLLQSSKDNPDSPHLHETGLTPEDWIIAFMTHLQETGKPLDDAYNPTNQESHCVLTGVFFLSSACVPGACWYRGNQQVYFGRDIPGFRSVNDGSRFSVMI